MSAQINVDIRIQGLGEITEYIMKLQIHDIATISIEGREVMRITRVPSGWLYETWANPQKTKRNSTFVPYP